MIQCTEQRKNCDVINNQRFTCSCNPSINLGTSDTSTRIIQKYTVLSLANVFVLKGNKCVVNFTSLLSRFFVIIESTTTSGLPVVLTTKT